jgi:hypothetical protein
MVTSRSGQVIHTWRRDDSPGVRRTRICLIDRAHQGQTATSQAGRDHSAKGRRGNRESEGPSNNKPKPGTRDRKPLGRGVTCKWHDWTGSGSLGSSPACEGLVSNLLSVSSLLSSLPAQQLELCGTIIIPSEVIAPHPSLLDFARPPALWGNGGLSLTGRVTHAWHRLSAGTPVGLTP